MSNLPEIVCLVIKLHKLAKEEWGEEYLDCDCGHDKSFCKCDCFMCEQGWQLTEYLEVHGWEKKLLPLLTSRNPAKHVTAKKER